MDQPQNMSLTERLQETERLLNISLGKVQLLENAAQDNNDYIVLIFSTMIALMQCGFAFLEAGSVRSKNATNILLKNVIDCCISAICYFAIGWALSFGRPACALFGYGQFFFMDIDPSEYAFWFLHFLFAANSSTIISGALAERCQMAAYVLFCVPVTTIIYPPVAHWVWADVGWLRNGPMGVRFMDFAGSGAVHLVGGVCGLVGAKILGPRIGRFDDDRTPDMKGHSVPTAKADIRILKCPRWSSKCICTDEPWITACLKKQDEAKNLKFYCTLKFQFAMLGCFILMFGFFAFNASSAVGQGGHLTALCMINTMMSGTAGALVSLVVERVILKRKWSLLVTVNSTLAALVAACAGCNELHPWAATVVGGAAALTCMGVANLMVSMRVDDPLNVVAVHAGGGLIGLITTPLLSFETGVVFNVGRYESYLAFVWNMIGAVSIILWCTVTSVPIFLLLKRFNLLRVSEEVETKGLDIYIHGEPAYPLAAYGHGWTGDSFSEEDQKMVTDAKLGLGHAALFRFARENELENRASHRRRNYSSGRSTNRNSTQIGPEYRYSGGNPPEDPASFEPLMPDPEATLSTIDIRDPRYHYLLPKFEEETIDRRRGSVLTPDQVQFVGAGSMSLEAWMKAQHQSLATSVQHLSNSTAMGGSSAMVSHPPSHVTIRSNESSSAADEPNYFASSL